MSNKIIDKLKFLGCFNQISIFINKLCSAICILLGLSLVAIITLEVFFRYVLNNALSWPEEIAGFMFVWFSMLGAAICLFKGTHIKVTFVVTHFNQKVQYYLKTFVHLLVILFSYILVERGYSLLHIVSMQVSPAAQINMVWEYSAIPITGAIFIFYSIVSILNNLLTGNDSIRGDLKP